MNYPIHRPREDRIEREVQSRADALDRIFPSLQLASAAHDAALARILTWADSAWRRA